MLTYDHAARPLTKALLEAFFQGDEPPLSTGLTGLLTADDQEQSQDCRSPPLPSEGCIDWLTVNSLEARGEGAQEPGLNGDEEMTVHGLLSTSTTWVCDTKEGRPNVPQPVMLGMGQPLVGLDNTERKLDEVITHRQEFSASCFKAKLRAALDKGLETEIGDDKRRAVDGMLAPAPVPSALSQPEQECHLEPVRLKVHFSRMNRTRVLSVSPVITFQEFQQQLDMKPNKGLAADGLFEAQYTDDEGDWIALEDECDWAEMWFQYHRLGAANTGSWAIHIGPATAVHKRQPSQSGAPPALAAGKDPVGSKPGAPSHAKTGQLPVTRLLSHSPVKPTAGLRTSKPG
eukprot:GGOE01003187.1.p1 GENE.GGOE01003187.1~~GGOE01003187.1.p1  ORF type:complete len:344 (-),score=43.59 GGOE01003187.1:420-1451(-)